MSDTTLRTLEAAAMAGDTDAAVRLLRERARIRQALTMEVDCEGGECGDFGHHHEPCGDTGKVRVTWHWGGRRGRWALAAYCGDEWCRHKIERSGCVRLAKIPAFRDFLQGLARWPHEAMLRAAVAAAWVTWSAGYHDGKWAPESSCADYDNARRALESMGRYLADPTEENWRKWNALTFKLGGPELDWVPRAVETTPEYRHLPKFTIKQAARLAGESPVRKAIQAALIKRSLGNA